MDHLGMVLTFSGLQITIGLELELELDPSPTCKTGYFCFSY